MFVKIVFESPIMSTLDHNMYLSECDSVRVFWGFAEPETDSQKDWDKYEARITALDAGDYIPMPVPASDLEVVVAMTKDDSVTYKSFKKRDGNFILYYMDNNGHTVDKRKYDWARIASQLA